MALLIVVGAGIALIVRVRDNRAFYAPAALLSRFPAEDGAALSVDFKTLRNAGLLSESKRPLEPEYKQFLDDTGFDYRRDLDYAVASFSKSGNYFIAHGHFNWGKLRAYAIQRGGSCYSDLCRVTGSTPERRISFLPLRTNAIALAVSSDDLAASRLIDPGPPVTAQIPSAPVWLSVPGAMLNRPGGLPQGARLLLSTLTRADRVLITIAATNNGIEAALDVPCKNAEDARQLASQLRSTTGMLKEAMLTNKEASRDELARALAAGTFDSTGPRVTGKWPLAKTLLESLTAGI